MWRLMRRVAILVPVLLLAACGSTSPPPGPSSLASSTPSPATAPSPAAASPLPSPAPPAPAASPAPVAWGPLSGGSAAVQPSINDVRVGSHPGYDRLVVQFTTGVPRFQLAPNPWTNPAGGLSFTGGARGDWVTLQGSYGVQLRIQGLDWVHDTYAHGTNLVPGFDELKQVRLTGDFEGIVTIAIGLARNVHPVVTILGDPARLVIDFPSGG